MTINKPVSQDPPELLRAAYFCIRRDRRLLARVEHLRSVLLDRVPLRRSPGDPGAMEAFFAERLVRVLFYT